MYLITISTFDCFKVVITWQFASSIEHFILRFACFTFACLILQSYFGQNFIQPLLPNMGHIFCKSQTVILSCLSNIWCDAYASELNRNVRYLAKIDEFKSSLTGPQQHLHITSPRQGAPINGSQTLKQSLCLAEEEISTTISTVKKRGVIRISSLFQFDLKKEIIEILITYSIKTKLLFAYYVLSHYAFLLCDIIDNCCLFLANINIITLNTDGLDSVEAISSKINESRGFEHDSSSHSGDDATTTQMNDIATGGRLGGIVASSFKVHMGGFGVRLPLVSIDLIDIMHKDVTAVQLYIVSIQFGVYLLYFVIVLCVACGVLFAAAGVFFVFFCCCFFEGCWKWYW